MKLRPRILPLLREGNPQCNALWPAVTVRVKKSTAVTAVTDSTAVTETAVTDSTALTAVTAYTCRASRSSLLNGCNGSKVTGLVKKSAGTRCGEGSK